MGKKYETMDALANPREPRLAPSLPMSSQLRKAVELKDPSPNSLLEDKNT